MTENDKMARRLDELERRAAHFERMAEDLSEVIADQGKAIERLTVQVRYLSDRLKGVESGWEASPQDGKPPPHY